MERLYELMNWLGPLAAVGLVGIVKWVSKINVTVNNHSRDIARGLIDHDECRDQQRDTAVRFAEDDQRHEHIHDTLVELKADVKELLRAVRLRLPNGVER